MKFVRAIWKLLVGIKDVLVLISHHADGEMIAQVCKHMGLGTIRGSSTRGGIKAMREMIRATVRDGRISEMSVYCTGDWDRARQDAHARTVKLARP